MKALTAKYGLHAAKVAACGAGMYFEQDTDNIQGRNGCDDGQAMYKSVTSSLDHGQWQSPANWGTFLYALKRDCDLPDGMVSSSVSMLHCNMLDLPVACL